MAASVSIIVPALNEEGNLRGTEQCVKGALKKEAIDDYEILIFNDGSTDRTGEVARELAAEDEKIKAIDNPGNMGFGYNYTEGVRLATKDYVMMVPGDNEIPEEAIRRVLAMAGEADMVVPYTSNTEVRPATRRIISRLFVVVINTLFGLGVRYYNGTCLHRAELLKLVPMKSWDFAYMAAILVRLIKSGATYVEVGVEITQREAGASKAFALKNVVSVGRTILTLFWDVQIKRDRVNV